MTEDEKKPGRPEEPLIIDDPEDALDRLLKKKPKVDKEPKKDKKGK
jgi:hypothetical protein